MLPGEGMPVYYETLEDRKRQERGDLVVQFKVEFPKTYTDEQRQVLKSVLVSHT